MLGGQLHPEWIGGIKVIEQTLTVKNEKGLRERAASIFVNTAMQFVSDIFIEEDDRIYNAKSIMSVLSMSASQGDELHMTIEGKDEAAASRAMDKLFNDVLV